MTAPERNPVQMAIDFLVRLDSVEGAAGHLPPRPDPDALVRLARERGLILSGEALQEGFRILMRARLFANQIARGSGPAVDDRI
ncbi:MAG: hypothetical protein ACXW3O_03135 [Brevundimonas sp.]